eukprot:jgi/Chrpa1/27711/Chrysochromulina_OHIO_Genome00001954-RA
MRSAALRLAPLTRTAPRASLVSCVRKLSSLPPHTLLPMPALSPTMTSGNLASWKKAVGDKIEAGDVIAEVETDKATVDYEAVDEGIIAKILKPEGTQDITVGTPIAVLVMDPTMVAAFKDYAPSAGAAPAPAAPKAASAPAPAPASAAAPAAPAPAATTAPAPPPRLPAGKSAPASPYAKALAAKAGIALATIAGTGPGGRIIAADVLEQAAKPAVAAAAPAAEMKAPAVEMPPGAAFVDLPNTQIRKVTAKRMVENKNGDIPHYYLTMEVEMDALMEMRASVNAAQDKVKTSVNDYVIKACAYALKEVPACNSQWTDEYIRQFAAADISVAVNTDRGLLTPIIFSADTKSVVEISQDVKSLAGKAKAGKLKPAEFIGGTFTVSNLGMTGVKQFTAIINGPQACILAVGSAEKKLVPGPDQATPFLTKTVMAVTLSSDHRIVDGAIGAEWLKAFKKAIENPVLLLL